MEFGWAVNMPLVSQEGNGLIALSLSLSLSLPTSPSLSLSHTHTCTHTPPRLMAAIGLSGPDHSSAGRTGR